MDIPPTAVRVQTCVLQCGCAHAGSVHNVRRSVRTHGAHLGRQVVVGLARPAHGLRRHLGVEAGGVHPVHTEGDKGLRGGDDERAADVGHEL